MEFKRDFGSGIVTWDVSVSGMTGYRSDLARGISAVKVPYSAADVHITNVNIVTADRTNVLYVSATPGT